MNKDELDKEQELIKQALNAARDTKHLEVEHGIRHRTADIFSSMFGTQPALIVADGNTYRACGQDVEASFVRENRALLKPFIFGPHVFADDECVAELVTALQCPYGYSSSRRFGNDQRSYESGGLSDQTSLHGCRDSSFHGRVCRIRRIHYHKRIQEYGGLSRPASSVGRSRRHRTGPHRNECLGLW